MSENNGQLRETRKARVTALIAGFQKHMPDVTTLTLAQSVRTLRLTLWDETRQQLVGFRDVIVARPASAA